MQNAGISSVLATNAKYIIPNNELKEGQIVVGKVNEVAEDGTARIIINGKIITATVVEEALSKGKFYFEVKDFKEGIVELKVISEIKQNDQKNAAQILKELDIPFTNESDAVIKLFLQSERAITKSEVLIALNQLEKSSNKQLVLDSLSFLIKKDFPITEKLLQTLVEGSKQELSALLSQIADLQDELLPSSIGRQLQSMIGLMKNNSVITDFQNEQFHFAHQLISGEEDSALLSTWNKQFAIKEMSSSKGFQEDVFQNLFKTAENAPTVGKAILTILSELPEFNVIKSELSRIPLNLANQLFINTVETSLVDESNKSLSHLLPFSQTELKEVKNKLFSFMTNQSTSLDIKSAVIAQVLTAIKEDGNLNQMTKLFLQNQILNGIHSASNDPVNEMFQLINRFDTQNQEISSDQIAKQISNHNDLIGLHTESKIRDLSLLNKAILSEQFPTLKEIALKALHSNIPDGVKQGIEQLITKITAGQLTSIHQNGPEYNLSTVVPIMINNWSTDLMIKWSGKESTSNSKQIQSNYCHILFFLELETLKETMVDVSIQNRVVNVTIHNNKDELNSIITSTFPIIKESLAKHEFHLSSLKCLPFNREHEKKVNELRFNNSLLSSREYTGVDLFI